MIGVLVVLTISFLIVSVLLVRTLYLWDEAEAQVQKLKASLEASRRELGDLEQELDETYDESDAFEQEACGFAFDAGIQAVQHYVVSFSLPPEVMAGGKRTKPKSKPKSKRVRK